MKTITGLLFETAELCSGAKIKNSLSATQEFNLLTKISYKFRKELAAGKA